VSGSCSPLHFRFRISRFRPYSLAIAPRPCDPLAPFAYTFPPSAIAQAPASPRDASKVAVVNPQTGRIAWDVFRNIGAYLPANALLVFNDTKVIPARMRVRKPTGGAIDLLCIGTERGCVMALANKAIDPGTRLTLPNGSCLTVVARKGTSWRLRPDFPLRDLRGLLEASGRTPLPPYIKQSPLPESRLRRVYQSVWARVPGSVAAPTASLHFTKRLLGRLKRQGIGIVHITHHVNLGTFATLTDEQLAAGSLHEETYVINPAAAKSIEAAKKAGRPIIAVGTTVVRALESSADARGRIIRRRGSTTLFIREGYRFQLVAGLITNFHVPRSSLLMLVAAFMGRERLLRVYRMAVRRGFRLFSFGDAMVVLPQPSTQRTP
jgi:S-adenosylmethionine:tRNA ribosyltransferase-isomerase